jgi:hypothetical protein
VASERDYQVFFTKTKFHVVSLILSVGFKNVFGIFLASLARERFLEFKNIILEATINCPINSKTVMKNFSHVRLLCHSLNFMVLAHPSKKSQNHGNPFFVFVGQFSFQNDAFKLKEVFSEDGIRVFLENGLGSFQAFLI